jgi:hypothetical protein
VCEDATVTSNLERALYGGELQEDSFRYVIPLDAKIIVVIHLVIRNRIFRIVTIRCFNPCGGGGGGDTYIFSHDVQTGSGTRLVSYSVGAGGSSRGKAAG